VELALMNDKHAELGGMMDTDAMSEMSHVGAFDGVNDWNGTRVNSQCTRDESTEELKTKVGQRIAIQPAQQTLTYQGTPLQPGTNLNENQIVNGSTVSLEVKVNSVLEQSRHLQSFMDVMWHRFIFSPMNTETRVFAECERSQIRRFQDL
jgi:hypothetical protein